MTHRKLNPDCSGGDRRADQVFAQSANLLPDIVLGFECHFELRMLIYEFDSVIKGDDVSV